MAVLLQYYCSTKAVLKQYYCSTTAVLTHYSSVLLQYSDWTLNGAVTVSQPGPWTQLWPCVWVCIHSSLIATETSSTNFLLSSTDRKSSPPSLLWLLFPSFFFSALGRICHLSPPVFSLYFSLLWFLSLTFLSLLFLSFILHHLSVLRLLWGTFCLIFTFVYSLFFLFSILYVISFILFYSPPFPEWINSPVAAVILSLLYVIFLLLFSPSQPFHPSIHPFFLPSFHKYLSFVLSSSSLMPFVVGISIISNNECVTW